MGYLILTNHLLWKKNNWLKVRWSPRIAGFYFQSYTCLPIDSMFFRNRETPVRLPRILLIPPFSPERKKNPRARMGRPLFCFDRLATLARFNFSFSRCLSRVDRSCDENTISRKISRNQIFRNKIEFFKFQIKWNNDKGEIRGKRWEEWNVWPGKWTEAEVLRFTGSQTVTKSFQGWNGLSVLDEWWKTRLQNSAEVARRVSFHEETCAPFIFRMRKRGC